MYEICLIVEKEEEPLTLKTFFSKVNSSGDPDFTISQPVTESIKRKKEVAADVEVITTVEENFKII